MLFFPGFSSLQLPQAASPRRETIAIVVSVRICCPSCRLFGSTACLDCSGNGRGMSNIPRHISVLRRPAEYLVAESISYDNNYEFVQFSPEADTTYKIRTKVCERVSVSRTPR